MAKLQSAADDDWPWWPGDPTSAPQARVEDAEEPERISTPSPTSIVPADPPFYDVDDAPDARPLRAWRAQRRRRLARLVAPLLALTLLVALIAVLRLPDSSSQPAIAQSAVNSSAAQPAADIQAYIVGAVVHPGVYPLNSGDRVDTLLQKAGGALPDADLVRVNLAAHVTDGEEVYVPRVGEALPGGLDGGGPGKVNINTASAEDMHTLLGISLTTATKIVAYRQAHGNYTAITQLLNVMSRSTYDKIKDHITV